MSIREPHTTPIRRIDGHDVPTVGRWIVDPGHTTVEFVGRHFMLTKVRGRISEVTGTVVVAADPGDSSVEATMVMSSVTSANADRDGHLRSADFFNVDVHPTATFRSTAVRWRGHSAKVEGDLTIVGITRPVVLDVEFLGATADPWGGTRAIFSASTEIDREAWGLTWNQVLETGGLLVSKKIRIEIETETVLER